MQKKKKKAGKQESKKKRTKEKKEIRRWRAEENVILLFFKREEIFESGDAVSITTETCKVSLYCFDSLHYTDTLCIDENHLINFFGQVG